MSAVAARFALVSGRIERDVVFHLRDGYVERIERGVAVRDAAYVLVPAVHNAHSHAFQWALRGRTHQLAPGREADDFWSWREQMYALADELDASAVEAIATDAYRAMVRSGYASVGEFHYLHHGPGGVTTHPRWETAEAMVRAARTAGIHLVLIPVLYRRAGSGRPPLLRQRRFVFESAADFVDYVRGMRASVAGPTVDVAIGVHSVRAADLHDIGAIARASDEDGVVRHVHASEQRRELAECRAETGMSPIAALRHAGFLGPSATVVHATHLDALDVELLASTGTTVCACPTTERDLGDGLLDTRALMQREIPIAVGSDSHAVVDAAEELRLLELHERLRFERRNVLALPERGWLRVAQALMACAGAGARSLGLGPGDLSEGARFDALELDDPGVRASDDDPWLAIERWLFVPGEPHPRRVYVGGVPVVGAAAG